MNVDKLEIRELQEGEWPAEDEVLVVGSPKNVKRLAANLKAVKKRARKAGKASRKKNRRGKR